MQEQQARGQMRVLDVDLIRPVEMHPPIAPALELGPRPIASDGGSSPLSLADPRPFQIELPGATMVASENSAVEQGKTSR